jgi:integrase
LFDRKNRLPHEHATRYTLVLMRGRAATTIRNHLEGIAIGNAFCTSRNVDLVDRAASGAFLSWDELCSLRDRMSMTMDGSRLIGAETALNRYRSFVEYVLWLTEPVVARASPDRRGGLVAARQEFEKRSRKAGPKAGPADGNVTGERHGLDPVERELFLRVIRPGDPANPFSPAFQVRNHAILLTSYKLGLRSGEILGAKVRDIRFEDDPAYITIHRRQDDPEDPRAEQPVAKTKARILVIDDELRQVLLDWILKERADRKRFPLARKNPYLVVNRRGEPLGARGFRKIYQTLRGKHPELEGLVNHVLRHDWNERWIERGEAENWDAAEAAEDQKFAMGWSHTSKMPERYAKRAIGNRTNRRILGLQDKAIRE